MSTDTGAVGGSRDQIRLTGLGAVGYHGVFEHEKKNGQPFFVDLALYCDLRQAGRSDDLKDTVDYGAVAEAVRTVVTGPSFDLIEALAERIAAELLSGFALRAVEVTVHKPKAPIEVTFSDVSVTVYRECE